LLTNETNEDSIDGNPSSTKIQKPPPIFVHGVINYGDMIKQIRDTAENEQYCTKSLANNDTKINCVTPESYRKLVRYFKDNNIFYHTYQLKEETAYRIAIRYLHHSTNTEDIKQELFELGHNVRNIINAQHKTTKEPLNLFFVDLEPAKNNKEIYNVKASQNKIIQTQPPRVTTSKYQYIPRNNIQHTTWCLLATTKFRRRNTNQAEDTAITVTNFLGEFKGLLNQVLQQNSTILNMLTTLIRSIKIDNFLRIAQWNANGLQSHKEEIQLF